MAEAGADMDAAAFFARAGDMQPEDLAARGRAAANRRIQRTQEEDATTVRRGQPAVAQNDPISCYGT